jgi:hypothetical protein
MQHLSVSLSNACTELEETEHLSIPNTKAVAKEVWYRQVSLYKRKNSTLLNHIMGCLFQEMNGKIIGIHHLRRPKHIMNKPKQDAVHSLDRLTDKCCMISH